jgi:hypothetical protein
MMANMMMQTTAIPTPTPIVVESFRPLRETESGCEGNGAAGGEGVGIVGDEGEGIAGLDGEGMEVVEKVDEKVA